MSDNDAVTSHERQECRQSR